MPNRRVAQGDRDSRRDDVSPDAQAQPDELNVDGPSANDVEAAFSATDNDEDVTQDTPVTEVDRLADEARLANERALRFQAELENFRKRMRREMEDERRYAAVPLIVDLLTVVDDLGRAIEASQQSENASGLLEGVEMVATQLVDILEKHQCCPIEAAGKPFDPHFQEALAQEPSDEYPPGVVTRVVRMGYRMHDRVVRPSQVLVSTGPPASADAPQGPVDSDSPE